MQGTRKSNFFSLPLIDYNISTLHLCFFDSRSYPIPTAKIFQSDQRDRYSGRISVPGGSIVRVPDTAFAHPHLCKVLLPVPDGTLTFLIALPPFQNHKINQYIFLQSYYSVFLLSHNHSHVLIRFLLLTYSSMLHLKLNLP